MKPGLLILLLTLAPAAGLFRYTFVAFEKRTFFALLLGIEPRPSPASWRVAEPSATSGQIEKLQADACSFSMAPAAGLEPATSKLTASCSTTELRRNIRSSACRCGQTQHQKR